MESITKSFGSVVANDAVSFSVNFGEIHALLGENGAGKSTLMNMLSGIYRPDSGAIFIDGEPASITSPKASINLGIGMIHQHFKLVDVMSALDNIRMGAGGKARGSRKKAAEEIRQTAESLGLDVKLGKKVYEMSVGEKQTTEIMKVLHRGSRIVIMDEPTAVLTPSEIRKLFEIMRRMKEQGCAIVIITHKLGEVMEISDRITVLRGGRSIDTVNTREVGIPALIEMMVGRRIDLKIDRPDTEKGETLLDFDAVTVISKDGKAALDEVSFKLHEGEILGVAGVAGSGQKELCEVIAGLTAAEKGRIFFAGENLIGKKPSEIISLGVRMGFIPEDRLGMGLVGTMDLVGNVMLKDYRDQRGIMLRRDIGAEKARAIVEKLDVLTPSVYTPVAKLSGGNIQKVLLGREIDSEPKLLVTAYPVRGLDIGASFKIYDLLNEQKKKGVGIVFVGEDLDVLLEISDRILVMSGGKVTGVLDATRTTKEEVGFLMAGGDSGGLSA
jgi:simple sugar transport system ATP-binding protein